MTTADPATSDDASAPRILSVGLSVGAELFFYGLFWGGIVLGLLTLNVAANGIFSDSVESSVWGGGGIMTRYLFDAAGVMIVVSSLPMYLNYGVTRREFVAGAVPAGLGVALLAALAATLVFLLEGLVYDVADWPHVLDGGHTGLYDRPDELGLVLLEWFAVYGSHLLSGMLIGASFSRLGPVFGALLLPLSALPAVGTELALGAGGAGDVLGEAIDVAPPHAAVGLLVTVGLAGAAVAGVRWLTRDIAIDNQRVVWWR